MKSEVKEQMMCPSCHTIGDFFIHRYFGRLTCGSCNRMYQTWAAAKIRSEAQAVVIALNEEEGMDSRFDIFINHNTDMDVIVRDDGYPLENYSVDFVNAELTDIYSNEGGDVYAMPQHTQ